MRTRSYALACLLGLAAIAYSNQAQSNHAERVQFFEKHIRPVLVKECYSCHSTDADEIKGGLTLNTREGIRNGGDRGPAVLPGNVRQSLLIKAIRHTGDDLQMPPKKRLSPEVISSFERWVALGAPDPRVGESVVVDKYKIDMEKARKHWAFQTPKRAQAPSVNKADWPRTYVDRFVLAALESIGLHPVDDADRQTLLRRLTFDLSGLPPTPDEVEAHADDKPGESFEEAVDRLLESPRFGEKWARHWLDVAWTGDGQ